jgi:hypothetical protein
VIGVGIVKIPPYVTYTLLASRQLMNVTALVRFQPTAGGLDEMTGLFLERSLSAGSLLFDNHAGIV